MKSKLNKILLVLIIAIFSIQLKVQATTIVSTDKEVQSNSGSVTINITSKQKLGAFAIKLIDTAGLTLENTTKSSDAFVVSEDKLIITGSSADGVTSLGSYTFKIPTVTEDKTYNVKFSITSMETTSMDEIPDETNTAVITVKAPVVETPPEETPTTDTPTTDTPTTDTPTTDTPVTEPPATDTPSTDTPSTTTKKSSEARLKTLGITPAEYDFSGFSKDTSKLDWEAKTVPNSVSSINVYAEAKDSKAKVSGTGKITLNEGNNKVGIKVTAEDGTTKTYTISIYRKTTEEEEKENGEAGLKNLGINLSEYNIKDFKTENLQYSTEVPNEINQIEVIAEAIDSRAQITGLGIIDLKEGINELNIDVIAVNGNKKTYTLKITRKQSIETESIALSTLSITGIKLNPMFKPGTFEYNVEVTEDINSLEINTKANKEDSTIEIIGNENLKQGENIITIIVKEKETGNTASYQITVNKEIVIETNTVKKSWLNPATWGKEEKIKIALMVVLIILIICAVLLKLEISKGYVKSSQRAIFPGTYELDKALIEHQELVSEDKEIVNEDKENTKNKAKHF